MHWSNIAAMAALLPGASAHIFMRMPVPFTNGPAGKLLQSSPLGHDAKAGAFYPFPCQFGADFNYPMDNALKVVAGSSILLGFEGSAIHGSGSCQVSLAKKASADPKDWKVIHSIIGGCPGTSQGGNQNLPNLGKSDSNPIGAKCSGNNTDEIGCLKQYTVTIPKEVASGQYFFAWTWFNKIGNREMYMNCAPLEVTGGSNSDDFLNAQPSIFYANYDKQLCETTEGFSVDFPQPGNSVLRSNNTFDSVSSQALGQCAPLNPAQQSQPASVSFLLHATTKNATVPAYVTTTSISATTPVTGSALGVSSAASAPAASAPVASVPTAPIVSSAPVANCANPCPEDGKVICLPPNNFGICDHGCATSQALAVGTKCENGLIVGLPDKRDIKKVYHVIKPRCTVARDFAA
jgi:hypothetical protein